MTFLCISLYFKGTDFLKACNAAGHTVYLLTKKSLEDSPWPRESLADIFYLTSEANTPQNFESMTKGLAWLLQDRKIDRIVALDDFDVEKAAMLREEFRIPGMGQTTARYFRDKLAMRMRAAEAGVPVPPFSALFNNDAVNHYADTVAPPWVVKPRSEASATGIRKVDNKEQLWEVINSLGDERHRFLVEQFIPGNVYHVDALSQDAKIIFCQVSKYLNTPFEVAHGGGIFRSQTVAYGSEDDQQLQAFTKQVMDAFGLVASASHTEFIKGQADGKFYFLETSSRVGGAHLAEMVEVASGINLWAEWARLESAMLRKETYQLPPVRQTHAGILISLARFEHPDTSDFKDQEIVWRLQKPHHVGFILRSDDQDRISSLLEDYAHRVYEQFHATAPIRDKPTD
ncbi:MAG: ATP-grasp domain-containing protein [Lewinella sp.]|nr:ATP-grasp domain-containing protein [Lewinella sp.]